MRTFSRLKFAHIFPRVYDAEVGHSSLLQSFRALTFQKLTLQLVRKGYPSKIIDTVDEVSMGDPIKIDSVQHVITLRSDLREYILYDTRITLQDLILDAE
jgi:hypothetical protein